MVLPAMEAVVRAEAQRPATEAAEAVEVAAPVKEMVEVLLEAAMVPQSHPMVCSLSAIHMCMVVPVLRMEQIVPDLL